MEVDEPRRQAADREALSEMAEEPREVVREAADEPRGAFGDSPFAGDPAHEPAPVPHDADLPQPLQEQADEPRKRPSV